MRSERFFDPLGETEPHTTRYALEVYIPPRPPPRWVPKIFVRKPVYVTNTGSAYRIRHCDTNPNLDCFEYKHLDELPLKRMIIKSAWFPASFRCSHIDTAPEKFGCNQGCYLHEKGGDIRRWHCERADCEGHVYCGPVRRDKEGKVCFGEKGKRMVCLKETY